MYLQVLRRTRKLARGTPITRSSFRLFSNRRDVREFTKPNLGFDPGLLEGKGYNRHDHPDRPASAYIHQVPPVVVDERVTVCDGGGGSLGHPRVFINLDKSTPEDPCICGYCGLGFVQKSHVPEGHPLLKNEREIE
eukprot:TRINITY_DN1994_c0_g1_i1.p1 TRINITY_DN1994_c0_g1~~TRINITY_DN1994_c0_g1_i1.p1  ORF type:complete len:136 (+),score=26.15 TRINITY_DN1994_c0_g1_i1:18-425(+)